MPHQTTLLRRPLLALWFAALLLFYGSSAGSAADDGSAPPTGYLDAVGIADGSPLRVWTDPQLRVWTYLDQPTQEVSPNFLPQYTGFFRTTLMLRRDMGEILTYVCGEHAGADFGFTAPTITKLSSSVIETQVTTANGNITITHTLTYITGSKTIRHDWQVTNTGKDAIDYTDVRLRYGGDSQLNGETNGNGYHDTTTAQVFCTNYGVDNKLRRMSMQGAAGAGFDRYIEGHEQEIAAFLIGTSDFPSEVNVGKDFRESSDNGMAVEWQYASLSHAGGSFTVTMFEKWSDSQGDLLVLGAPDFSALRGTTQAVNFSVQNLNVESRPTVSLAVNLPVGWSYNLPSKQFELGPDSSQQVALDVTIPADASGTGTVELVVYYYEEPDPVASDAVVITVDTPQVNELPTGGDLPLSTATRTIYTGINPSTPEGITSVIAALSGRSPLVTRAFIWDRQLSQYIDFATIPYPSEDLRVSTGIFIATRTPLAYDLNGSPTNAPYDLTLETTTSSWAFAGFPPVQTDQSTIQTEFTWPTSFLITHGDYDGYSGSSYEVTEFSYPYTLSQLMGDAQGSSVPLWWNGSSYVPAPNATLEAGKAYWFRNNAVQGNITITVQTAARRAQQQALLALDASLKAKTASPSSSLAAGLRKPAAAPPPPGGASGGTSGSGGSSASTGGGGGCGSGSGIGMLSMLMLFFGLRFLLVVRR